MLMACGAKLFCFSVAEQTDRTYAEQQERRWLGNRGAKKTWYEKEKSKLLFCTNPYFCIFFNSPSTHFFSSSIALWVHFFSSSNIWCIDFFSSSNHVLSSFSESVSPSSS